jgi:hypothetical protein
MTSDRRKKSSRANGAKSHRPSSPAGKKRSSRNAVQHGLLAKCLLLTGEDAKNFDILIRNHDRRFQPADGIEFGLVEEMCAAYGRLAALPGTALMQRYETRPQNMYARAIRTFKVLKTIPLPSQDDDIPDQDAPPIIELPKEPLSGAANPGCSRLSGGSPHSQTTTPAPPPSQKQSKAAG